MTTARVLAHFDDGSPAITEARIGKGTAVLIGFDAARQCWLPGQDAVEALIARLVWGQSRPGWECDAQIAFRRWAPNADHYFLLNPGPAHTVFIRAYDCAFRSGELVIEEQPLEVSGSLAIKLPAESAVWVRLEK